MPSLRPVACLPHGVLELYCISPTVVTWGTARTTDHLRFSRLPKSCSPSSSRSGLHVLCACTTCNMRSALAEALSIQYTTFWRLCGNEPRQTKPRTLVSLMRQKIMTQCRTLVCSSIFSNVVLRDPPLQYCRLCTRRHPAGCVLSGQPSARPLRCSMRLHKDARCPRCCM